MNRRRRSAGQASSFIQMKCRSMHSEIPELSAGVWTAYFFLLPDPLRNSQKQESCIPLDLCRKNVL